MENSLDFYFILHRLENLRKVHKMFSQKKKGSNATYIILQNHLKKQVFSLHFGESIDGGMLGEIHHEINFIVDEDLLLNEGVVLPFVVSLLTPSH